MEGGYKFQKDKSFESTWDDLILFLYHSLMKKGTQFLNKYNVTVQLFTIDFVFGLYEHYRAIYSISNRQDFQKSIN